MDIATVIGLVAAIGLVAWSIMMGSDLLTFVDIPSAVLVVGGCLGVTVMSFPLSRILRIVSIAKKAVFTKALDPVLYVQQLVKLAEIARRDGILSLEGHLNEGGYDDFMVRGLRLAIDGQDPAVIQASMEQELSSLSERHALGKAVFDALSKYAPAFGMLGTIIGLIVMLRNMDDPAKIGPGMALALITTFYGSLLSNSLFQPLADKLSLRSNEEIATKVLIIHGVMSIQGGDNPRIVRQKLLCFLNPQQRARAEPKE